MDWTHWRGRRKRRPREHVIAEMGVNFLERQVLRRGHQLRRVPEPEYGTDAMMLHFSPESREIENGWVEFQVKSTDQLSISDNGQSVACTVEFHTFISGIGRLPILSFSCSMMRRNTANSGLTFNPMLRAMRLTTRKP